MRLALLFILGLNQILLAQQKFRQDTTLAFFVNSNGNECAWDQPLNGMPQMICTCNNALVNAQTGVSVLWNGYLLNGNLLDKTAIWDGGLIRQSHREFNNRAAQQDNATAFSSHATSVGGSIIAQGLLPSVKGVAWQTNLKSYDFSNDNAEIILAAPNLWASNHSYASTCAWTTIGGSLYWYGDSSLNMFRDWKFGYYDNRSRIWDSITHAHDNYLMVKAAGNDRGNGVAPGTTHFYWNGNAWALSNTTRDTVGPYDCISTFGNAKNILTVGACTFDTISKQINLLGFSSFGPTDDGRIKPDLVAPSGSVYTTTSANDSSYGFLGGTSMSAPAVTGAITLLQQYYQQLNGVPAYNALIKAIIINGCISCEPNLLGPNYKCGWGFPQFQKSVMHLKSKGVNSGYDANTFVLGSNQSHTFNFFKQQTDTSKFTLCWTDPQGITAAPAYNDSTLKLVNDLNLRVLTSSNRVIFPFVLNPNNPAAPPTLGNNYRDNIEQIALTSIDSGGFYHLTVSNGALVNNAVQKYALATSGVLFEPMTSASLLQINAMQQSVNLNVLKGSGTHRLVLFSTQPIASSIAICGNVYTANSTFGLGSNLGNNTYCVYNDTGNYMVINGLQLNQNYFIAVIEYFITQAGLPVYENSKFLSVQTATLPVKLLSFNAHYNTVNNHVNLNWQTASEFNNKGFFIERSEDGINFISIEFVPGNGNSFITRSYFYEDKSLYDVKSGSIFYYRLKQLDKDGKTSYSKTIQIAVNAVLTDIQLYPNPASKIIFIKALFPVEVNCNIQLLNINGEIVWEEQLYLNDKPKAIDISHLNEGIYFLKVTTPGNTYIKKVVRITE